MLRLNHFLEYQVHGNLWWPHTLALPCAHRLRLGSIQPVTIRRLIRFVGERTCRLSFSARFGIAWPRILTAILAYLRCTMYLSVP